VAGCGAASADHEERQTKLAAVEAVADHRSVELANTEVRQLDSAITGQPYQIKIQFPRGYDDESARYPVLYVIDAETNFGGVGYITQRLVKDELIPKILIVGVAYDVDYEEFYRLRSRDLTPTEVPELRIGGKTVADPTGGAAEFAQFLERELIPFVEQNYRAEPGARALYGHSYGGLFASYVLMEHAQLFDRYLILSPSLWFNENELLAELPSVDFQLRPTRLYMASGALEGRIRDLQSRFAEQLEAMDPTNLRMKAEILPNETHRSIFGRGFTDGMRFLYAEGS